MSPLVGAVGPQAKIPWTKPQDLELTAMFPALGEPGSFATPYEAQGRQLAALGCFDGSLHLIPRDLKPATLRNLLTVTDGVLISEEEIPRIRSGGVPVKWWLTIEKMGAKSVATLECDVGTEMAKPVARTATTAP